MVFLLGTLAWLSFLNDGPIVLPQSAGVPISTPALCAGWVCSLSAALDGRSGLWSLVYFRFDQGRG